jgi:hypothetical protein
MSGAGLFSTTSLIRRAFAALCLGVAASAAAQTFDAAQWKEQKDEESGAIYLSCTAAACGGPTSSISYAVRQDLEKLDLETFIKQQEEIETNILNPRFRVKAVQPLDLGAEKLEDHQVMWRMRSQTNFQEVTAYIVSAFVKKDKNGLSILSAGISREAAMANFRAFLPQALKLAREKK